LDSAEATSYRTEVQKTGGGGREKKESRKRTVSTDRPRSWTLEEIRTRRAPKNLVFVKTRGGTEKASSSKTKERGGGL